MDARPPMWRLAWGAMPAEYRTPGTPEFVEALGWCVRTFLYLEEVVVRWMRLLRPEVPLSEWRRNTAFRKGEELRKELNRRSDSFPADLRTDLYEWLSRYEDAVRRARNVVAHGHVCSERTDPDEWQPGLAYTDPNGNQVTVARSVGDLHAIAKRTDDLMGDLYALEPRLRAALDLPPAT